MSLPLDNAALANLTPEQKRDLLQKLMARKAQAQAPAAPPVEAAKPQPVPLSMAQQRLWFLHELDPQSHAYNLMNAFHIKGRLDRDALRKALAAMSDRHESLRTVFRMEDERPVQVILNKLEPRFREEDLRGADNPYKEAYQRHKREAMRPYDLTTGPLIRYTLYQLGEAEYVFLVASHHIISDIWSMGVFNREAASLYGAYTQNRNVDLMPLKYQFKDFARWEKEALTGEKLERQLKFWCDKLAGVTVSELPTDRPRPSEQRFYGAVVNFEIAPATRARLAEAAAQSKASSFMVMLAAFKALLYRYTGQTDINVGTPISNRNRTEAEGLIGFFVNTQVMRTQFTDDPTFLEILERVRTTALEAYTHPELPFERLVDELAPERDLSRNPLTQIMFQTGRLPDLNLTGLQTRVIWDLDWGVIRNDLECYLSDNADGGLDGLFVYATDLFDQERIQRLARQFSILMDGLAAHPRTPISMLPLLTDEERHLILEAYHPRVSLPNICAHQAVEQHAAAYPDDVALRDRQGDMTYAVMNQKADIFARNLVAQGVRPGQVVAVQMSRCRERIIATLAVLKAGAVFQPIDPDYPISRTIYMVEDAAAEILITQPHLEDSIPNLKARKILVDSTECALLTQDPGHPLPEAVLNQGSYLIYTSGSTGKPKGAMLNHRGLVNIISCTRNTLGCKRGEGLFQFASFGFDACVWEVFMALGNGGWVYLCDEEISKDPHTLARECERSGITTITLPPTMLRLLEFEPGKGPTRIMSAGEACGRDLIVKFGRNRRFFNAYGPTETTICSSWVRCIKGDKSPSLGRSMQNVSYYIVDRKFQLLPLGAVGEICVAGVGVGFGYVNRTALTADRFQPNPFSNIPGDRLYRTGDLGMMRPDGEVEYLGRIDFQVKIYGHRIELEEIEVVLGKLARPKTLIVLAREIAGTTRLVAYMTEAEVTDPEVLRAGMEEQLPFYMVPGYFVFLDQMPITPNGKVDRKALPLPTEGAHRDFVAPKTETEKILAEIWAEALGLERVGREDNFFQLGGDSIVSVNIISKARQKGVELRPKMFFKYQTLSKMAAKAVAAGATTAEQGFVEGQVALYPIQRWFFDKWERGFEHFNQAVWLDIHQDVNPDHLETALQALVRHHDALRLRYHQKDGVWVQAHQPLQEARILQRHHLTGAETRTEMARVKARLHENFDLGEGPLIRAVLFDGAGAPGLFIVIHHLVVDGVSWRILREDLNTAYEAAARGTVPKLAEKTTSFKAWVERLTQEARKPHFTCHEAFWLEQSRAYTPMPVDFLTNRAENRIGAQAEVTVSLTEDATQSLLQEAPAAYNTQINDLLLAALCRAFFIWTGNHHLAINLEGHGREDIANDIDISRTVGWFTSIFPVNLNTEGAVGYDTLIKTVKEQLRRVPDHGLSFGLLQYLGANQAWSKQVSDNLYPEIAFNYLGRMDEAADNEDRFRFAEHGLSASFHPEAQRPHLIDINAVISKNQLHIHLNYCIHIHQRATVVTFGDSLKQELLNLIRYCRAGEGAYTPSDFGLRDVSQEELDLALAEVVL